GLQGARSEFDAIGDESYLPPSTTTSGAIFVMESWDAGPLRLEAALRQEWQKISAEGRPWAAKHSPFSVSAAAVLSVDGDWSVGLSLARSERAPTPQELFADGVHLATNSYEIGNPDLGKEATKSVELNLRKTEGATRLTLGLFHYRVDDHIYAATLDKVDDMRLVRYAAADARFTGIDGSITHGLTSSLDVTLFGDYVRGKFAEGGNLPRIPGGRLGGRVEWGTGDFDATVEYFHLFRQNRIAEFETATPGHDMLNLTLSYALDLGGASGQIYLSADNLLDVTARNHSSFIKDTVPLPGRNIVLGLRASF
ncbi:MAG TPA: TonB-dependent receptor, partial [Sphingomonadales bacterium]